MHQTDDEQTWSFVLLLNVSNKLKLRASKPARTQSPKRYGQWRGTGHHTLAHLLAPHSTLSISVKRHNSRKSLINLSLRNVDFRLYDLRSIIITNTKKRSSVIDIVLSMSYCGCRITKLPHYLKSNFIFEK